MVRRIGALAAFCLALLAVSTIGVSLPSDAARLPARSDAPTVPATSGCILLAPLDLNASLNQSVQEEYRDYAYRNLSTLPAESSVEAEVDQMWGTTCSEPTFSLHLSATDPAINFSWVVSMTVENGSGYLFWQGGPTFVEYWNVPVDGRYLCYETIWGGDLTTGQVQGPSTNGGSACDENGPPPAVTMSPPTVLAPMVLVAGSVLGALSGLSVWTLETHRVRKLE